MLLLLLLWHLSTSSCQRLLVKLQFVYLPAFTFNTFVWQDIDSWSAMCYISWFTFLLAICHVFHICMLNFEFHVEVGLRLIALCVLALCISTSRSCSWCGCNRWRQSRSWVVLGKRNKKQRKKNDHLRLFTRQWFDETQRYSCTVASHLQGDGFKAHLCSRVNTCVH